MLDYHLHLWPHDESSVECRLEQVAQYCEEAARHGVTELALTEHAFRFREVLSAVGPFWQRWGHEPTSSLMVEYFDFHAKNSLEDYVTLAQAAKDAGLPVKIGLEVDYYEGHMDEVAALLEQYPFDVLIGSVHWLRTWQFDDLDNTDQMAQWHSRDIAAVWDEYATAFDELTSSGAVDVVAHPDVIKVAGFVPPTSGTVWPKARNEPTWWSSARRQAGLSPWRSSIRRAVYLIDSWPLVSISPPRVMPIATNESGPAATIWPRYSRPVGFTN